MTTSDVSTISTVSVTNETLGSLVATSSDSVLVLETEVLIVSFGSIISALIVVHDTQVFFDVSTSSIFETSSVVSHSATSISSDSGVFVKIFSGEVFVSSVVDSEAPSGCTVTTSFGTINLKDVVSSVKSLSEVQLSRSSTLPDVRIVVFDWSSVHVDKTTTAEIIRNIESVGGSPADIEGDFVVETDVSVGSSSTESAV